MSSDPLWGALLLQAALILLSALFSSGETAIVELNESKLKKQAEEGDQKAAKLYALACVPNPFLLTMRIGLTLSGFLGAAFAASNFAAPLADALTAAGVNAPWGAINGIALLLLTLILAFITLVLGELVPKRIAIQKPEAIARLTGPTIGIFMALFRPVATLLSKCANGVLRIMGMNPHAQADEVTEEEIRMMVDIGEETGAIDSAEKEMIENIFEFNNIHAEDVMTHRTDVTSLWVNDERDEIIKSILETGLSRFPVYDEDADDIIGILSTRDYLLSAALGEEKTLRELLRPATFVPESVQADALFRDMQKNKVHMSVVVDEYGGMAGIVTMEDLLEEIVGNIYDEFDPPGEAELVQLSERLWRASGAVELETLEEAFQIQIPKAEDYDTLGGLVFSFFTSIPQDGSQPEITIGEMKIKVETILDHRIESALIELAAPEENRADTDKTQEE